MHPFEVLRKPLITEKNTLLQGQNKYLFEVAGEANKPQVKEAVELAFKVKVLSVNMITMPARTKRVGRHTSIIQPWKKAVVTLRAGDKITFFEGV